jgi:hypothetical protein
MSAIVTRLYYRCEPLRGLISVSEIHGLNPTKYRMVLFHDTRGCLIDKLFDSYKEAIHESNSYGFMSKDWNYEHKLV